MTTLKKSRSSSVTFQHWKAFQISQCCISSRLFADCRIILFCSYIHPGMFHIYCFHLSPVINIVQVSLDSIFRQFDVLVTFILAYRNLNLYFQTYASIQENVKPKPNPLVIAIDLDLSLPAWILWSESQICSNSVVSQNI